MVTPAQARKSAAILEAHDKPVAAAIIRDLASQVESLQADAERYRWLRKEGFYKDFNFGAPFMAAEFDGHDLDATVDQELARKQS